MNDLENYKKKITLNPKVIISSHSHFYNELFKLWSFQRKLEKKSKIIIFQHGGNHSKYNPVFDYEKNISNEFYDWKNSTKKLCGMTKYLNHNIKRKKNKKILFVGFEYRKYPCRFYPGPLHHEEMNSIDHLAYIVNGLNKNHKANFFFSPHRTILPSHKETILKHLDKRNILENLSLKKNIKNFSLIICSSPMTTFFDSILSGPTLLLMDKELWITEEKINTKYNILKKNKILFYNVEDLLKHLHNIYPENIYSWWYSKNVQYAINTGLNRLGFKYKDIDWIIQNIQNSPVKILSVYSHLAASEDEKNNLNTKKQIKIFDKIQKKFYAYNSEIKYHLLNSSGIFNYPENQITYQKEIIKELTG